MSNYGFGNEEAYEQIRRDIQKADLFKFNFHIRSRRVDDIKRRCATLALLVAKEMESDASRKVHYFSFC